jgi:hypothetical protein
LDRDFEQEPKCSGDPPSVFPVDRQTAGEREIWARREASAGFPEWWEMALNSTAPDTDKPRVADAATFAPYLHAGIL